MVADSLILLKNEGVLPLNPEKKTAFIGPYVDSRDTCGSWAIFQDREDTVTLREGVTECGLGENAEFFQGCQVLENTRVLGFGVEEVFGEPENREELLREAVEAARRGKRRLGTADSGRKTSVPATLKQRRGRAVHLALRLALF